MKLTMVGVGTCVPEAGVGSSCMVLHAGTRRFLVDAGTGTIQGLLSCGEDPLEVDGVFLTHHHPDHCGELPALLQSVVWGSYRVRSKPFYLVGGPGTGDLVASWARFYGDWIVGRSFTVEVIELAGSVRRTIEGLTLRSMDLAHTEASLAYRIEFEDRSVAVTGDTGPDEALKSFAHKANVLVTECSFPDQDPRAGHMTPSAVADLAAAASVGRVVLTHLYPECKPALAAKTVADRFSGPIDVAVPGLTLEI